MTRLKKLFIFMVLLASLFPVFSEKLLRMDLLQNVRGDIVFPELTVDEKRIVAEQAQLLLRDIYVNRFQKMDYYREHPDPVPAIAEVVDNINVFTTGEMETAIYNIIVSQRDLHLNYMFPAPYSDYSSFLPLVFRRTATRKNAFEVRIGGLNTDLYESFVPDQRLPEIGDEVIAYNNLPILEVVERQEKTSQGANVYGGFRRAIDQLTFVPHIIHPLPANDGVTMTLRSISKGDEYDITIPWIAYWFEEIKSHSDARGFNSPYMAPAKKKVVRDDIFEGTNLWQELRNDFVETFSLEEKSVYPAIDSNEETLKWGVIEDHNGKFGYLMIKSFSPVTGSYFAMNEIIRIINDEFDDTLGLIIDVRDNGGGSILYSEMFSQLFMAKKARLLTTRILNTDLNRYILNETGLGTVYPPEWTRAINEAEGTCSIYAADNPFFREEKINDIGQVYHRPVAVLNNAASYSATDMFSCIMQDNGFTIFGEDPKTGGGGANVLPHSAFSDLVQGPFEPMPKGHDMRFAYSQVLRFGRNEGRIIEDHGCDANRNVSMTPADLIDGGKGQLAAITAYLAKKSKRYRGYVKADELSRLLYKTPGDLNFGITVASVRYIQVIVDGKVDKYIPVYTQSEKRHVIIDLPVPESGSSLMDVTLMGRGWCYYDSWNMKKKITVLEGKYIISDDDFEIDFSKLSELSPITVVNDNTAPSDGWGLGTDALQVGYNPGYNNNVSTSAIMVSDLTQFTGGIFSFTMEMSTEENFDFFNVYSIIGNRTYSLFSGSGSLPLSTYSFDITPFAGMDNVVLYFYFNSDMNSTDKGVRITSLSVK